MASREARVTPEETEKNSRKDAKADFAPSPPLATSAKGAKVKTHPNVAQSTRTSGELTFLNERACWWFVLSSLTNPRTIASKI
jgi:hypothetical protein